MYQKLRFDLMGIFVDSERELLRHVAQGHTAKEVAERLGVSPRTLETYKARAMAKLDFTSRADLIRYAVRCGWLSETGRRPKRRRTPPSGGVLNIA